MRSRLEFTYVEQKKTIRIIYLNPSLVTYKYAYKEKLLDPLYNFHIQSTFAVSIVASLVWYILFPYRYFYLPWYIRKLFCLWMPSFIIKRDISIKGWTSAEKGKQIGIVSKPVIGQFSPTLDFHCFNLFMS